MHKATVNGHSYEVISDNDQLTLNGNPLTWNMMSLGNDHYHIVLDKKSYNAEVIRIDAAAKTATFRINGRMYTVEVKDKFDLLLEKMGMNSSAAGKINKLKAPMPGLIIDLKVKEGDIVKQNDPLIILEAMKMENIIKSPGDAVVKSVKVKKGDSVEKNQVLIEF